MPIDYAQYPANWLTEIRPRILARAQNRCEWCGVENGAPRNGRRVILTIAHLGTVLSDGTVVSKHDKSHEHGEALAVLCQSCHLRYDHADHIRHAAENRRKRKIDAGQEAMYPDVVLEVIP